MKIERRVSGLKMTMITIRKVNQPIMSDSWLDHLLNAPKITKDFLQDLIQYILAEVNLCAIYPLF